MSNIRTESGAERVLLDSLRTLPALEAIVAAPRGPFLETCRRHGVTARRLRAPTELRRREHRAWPLTFAARFAAALIEVTWLLVRERPDLVHANNFAAGIYALLPARVARVPIVWQIHDVFAPGSLEAKALRRLGPAARCVVAVSQTVRESLLGFGLSPEKIVTIPNAVDASARFDPARHQRGAIRSKFEITDKTVIIGIVGQVAEHKGSALILDAFERLVEASDAKVCLVIAGTAPPQAEEYEAALRRRVTLSPEMRTRVIWLGQRADVPDVLADSDVVVNASLVPEAFGMTILEGMAMAKVVVAPDAAGTAELVAHGSDGFLFQPGDVEDLARTLAEVVGRLSTLDDIRERARRKAVHHYAIERKRDATMALYEGIVGKASTRPGRGGHA